MNVYDINAKVKVDRADGTVFFGRVVSAEERGNVIVFRVRELDGERVIVSDSNNTYRDTDCFIGK